MSEKLTLKNEKGKESLEEIEDSLLENLKDKNH
jgi:hypothetical protein